MTTDADPQEDRILVVTTTVGSEAAATALARAMVEQRLAACVQIDREVTSLYRWKGDLCEDREARLVIKTMPERGAALRAFLAEHHPYELPQFVAMTAAASAEYAQWVRSEVSSTMPAAPAADARS
ncbi:MAG TPA: divalent-cation tolerance protein CutA [Ramlibacter sp.]